MLTSQSLILDGRFRVLTLLGGGGMGEVYLAEQVSLGRKVALKVLRQDLSNQPGMSERFRREARLLSSVDHPAVVKVIDFGQTEHASCLVMELAEGQTLKEALKAGPMPVERALPLLIQLCEGLAAIHEKGIVHRDLKPENVVLTQGPRGEQARLLDFGIAKLADPQGTDAGLSQVGLVLGTPEYLSPEQATGSAVEARSDLYCLGVLAFRALSGQLPFPGPAPRQFLAQHAGMPPAPLERQGLGLLTHPRLCAVVMRCLEKEPSARPASAAALAELLRRIPAEEGKLEAAARASTVGTALTPHRAGEPVRARNLTVMLTDIQGFTERTSRQTREQNAHMLAEHDRLLLPVVRAHRGALMQKRGDALFIAFQSPTEAVLCGMALQDRLYAHNLPGQRGAAEPLHIRVAVHLGEVLEVNGALVGDPVEVVGALESKVNADEVVFTEAVNLAMNKAEIKADAQGVLELPGREQPLQLYRCRPGPPGAAPFGGRDRRRSLVTLAWTTMRSERVRLWALLREATARSPARPPLSVNWAKALGHRRALAAGGLLLTLGAVWLLAGRTTARQVRAAIEQGESGEALRVLDAATKEGSAEPPGLRLLRGAALHQLARHDEELSALRSVTKAGWADADALCLSGVLEDYAQRPGEDGLRKVLDAAPRGELERWAKQAPGLAQWGALRYLEAAKATSRLDLVATYVARLAIPKPCEFRATAARRLGELGDPAALEALRGVMAEPKARVLVFEQDCGQDAAREATRAIEKRAGR